MTPQQRQKCAEKAINSGAPAIDLMPEDMLRELGGCQTRFIEEDGGWVGKYWNQEVFYRGSWRKVGHTSLYDDVATGLCARTIAEQTLTIARLLPMSFGVRLHDGCVSFITHMTDG